MIMRSLNATVPPEPPGDLLPRLQLLVDPVAPSPASVMDRHYDYLVWNQPYPGSGTILALSRPAGATCCG
jgi:hypothetical protein